MTNLFLAPASNEGRGLREEDSKPYKNLQRGVINQFKTDQYGNIPGDYGKKVGVWGVTENAKGSWKKLCRGDYILFYTAGSTDHFEYAAEVLGWKNDVTLSRELFPNWNEGHPSERYTGKIYRYLIFLDDHIETRLNKYQIREHLGYESGKIDKFCRVGSTSKEKVIQEFGSVENFIEDFSVK